MNPSTSRSTAIKRPTGPRIPPVDIESLTERQRAIPGITVSMGVQPEPSTPRLGEVPPLNVASTRRSTPTGPSSSPQGPARLDGTWRITFHHSARDQELILVLETSNGRISGSATSPALGVTVPIVEGTLDGNHFTFRAPLNMPVQVNIVFDGFVGGDSISGEITLQGGGTFPFEGTRA